MATSIGGRQCGPVAAPSALDWKKIERLDTGSHWAQLVETQTRAGATGIDWRK